MLHTLLTVLQVVCCVAIIFLVLIQRGKGAEAGAGFGAGASGTVFGARGASTALSRATAIFAAIFMINSLVLAYLGSKSSSEQPKTILDEAAAVQHPAQGNNGNNGAGGITSAPLTAPAPSGTAPAPGAPPAATVPAPVTPGQKPPAPAPVAPNK